MLAATVCGVLLAAPASAQVEEQATARALFNEARDLMKAGRYEEACPKLEAASKVYPGSGVLLNLGDCYEHVGRTASAWTEFGEAASVAERLGHAVDEAEAKRRQVAIEPRLSRLAVRVKSDAAGLVVKRDGAPLDPGAWGEAIPVDPGKHTVTAEAPGREAWSGVVDVEDAGKAAAIEVPELTPSPVPSAEAPAASAVSPPAAETPAAPAPPAYWTGRRVAGATIAAAGAVAAGAGAVLGLVARSQYVAAEGEAGSQRHDDSVAAVSTGNVATVVGIAGAVVAAGGLVLWLTAPSAPVQVGANGGAVVLGGRF